MASNGSNGTNGSNRVMNLIRRKIVRIPNLRPKTKLGQRTIGVNQSEATFQQLKGEYYENPAKLQPFVNYLKGRLLEDEELAAAPEGIYTWILKRGHLYAAGLMTNQEIGSLHVNIDVLTLHQENVEFIQANLKNRRTADAKPVAAGEILVVRGQRQEQEQDEKGEQPILYFNLQSGTYSEPLLKCRATALGEKQGIDKKGMKNAMDRLKRECRDEMVEEVRQAISRATGVSLERVRFLSCSEEIQRELEGVPLLQSGYSHGVCRDDDDYMESIAGRNLIRRFMATTSVENMGRFRTYFYGEASVLGKRRGNTRSNKNNKNKTGNKAGNKTRRI